MTTTPSTEARTLATIQYEQAYGSTNTALLVTRNALSEARAAGRAEAVEGLRALSEAATPGEWTFGMTEQNVMLRPERLRKPLTWREPRMVFVNSMSDLFHELVPWEFIDQVFDVMEQAERHTFQVLTKRPERMRALARPVPPNVWLGTSIENDRWTVRADYLRETPPCVRFLSCEPLLGPLPSLDLTGIRWVICGGESGEGHRPIRAEWVRDLRDRCNAAGIDFFFKQWGGRTPKAGGRTLDGRTWDERPDPILPLTLALA